MENKKSMFFVKYKINKKGNHCFSEYVGGTNPEETKQKVIKESSKFYKCKPEEILILDFKDVGDYEEVLKDLYSAP